MLSLYSINFNMRRYLRVVWISLVKKISFQYFLKQIKFPSILRVLGRLFHNECSTTVFLCFFPALCVWLIRQTRQNLCWLFPSEFYRILQRSGRRFWCSLSCQLVKPIYFFLRKLLVVFGWQLQRRLCVDIALRFVQALLECFTWNENITRNIAYIF